MVEIVLANGDRRVQMTVTMPKEHKEIARKHKINLAQVFRDAVKAELEKRGLLDDQ